MSTSATAPLSDPSHPAPIAPHWCCVPSASTKSICRSRQNQVRPSCSDKPHFWPQENQWLMCEKGKHGLEPACQFRKDSCDLHQLVRIVEPNIGSGLTRIRRVGNPAVQGWPRYAIAQVDGPLCLLYGLFRTTTEWSMNFCSLLRML